MAKEVAKKKSNNVVAFDEELLLADSMAGMENMSQDDFMIPRINILQALSPQVNKRDGQYIDGAEAGHIIDNVAAKVYEGEEGIVVVPISYRRAHIEWKADRNGFVKDHGSDPKCLESCSRGDRGEYITDEGNTISPTAEYFVFIVNDDGSHSPAMISMSGSKLKKARRWNSMINRLMVPHPSDDTKKFTPAMFWNAYKLTTVPEENDQGSWFNWDMEMMFDANSGGIIQQLPNGRDIYLAARDFKESVASGDVKVQPESTEDPDAM
jgi:hypothetical protein